MKKWACYSLMLMALQCYNASFDMLLKRLLEFCELSTTVFKGHSFRIGVAISATGVNQMHKLELRVDGHQMLS